MGCSHSKRREASPIDQLAPAKPATRPSKGVQPGPSNGAPYGSPDDSADAYVAQELTETGDRGVRARDLTSPISPTPSEGYIVTTDATPTPNATPRRQTLLSPAILVGADSARAAIATSTSLVSPDVIEEEVEADSAIGTDDRPSEGHSEHGTAVDGSDPHTEGVHEVHVHHEPSEGVVVSAEDAYGEHRPSLNPQAAIPRGDSLPGELIVDAGPQRVYDPEPEPHPQPLTAAAVAATAEARGDDLNESVESTATDITHFSSENGKDSPTYDFADALHTDPARNLEEAEEPPAGGLTSLEGAAEDAIPEETETPSPDGGALSAAATPAMEEVPSPEGVAEDSPPPPPPPEPSAGAVVVVAEASLSPTPNNDGGSTGEGSPGKAKRPTLVLTTAAGAAVVAAARTDKPPVPPRKPSLEAKPQVARKPSTDGKPPLPAKPEEEAILRNVKPSMRKRFSKFGRKRSSATSPDKSPSKDKRSSQGPTADVAGSPGKGGGASGATGPEAVDSSPARANTEAESGRAMAPTVDAHGNAIPEWRVSILQQRLDRQSQAGAGDTGVMSPQGSPPKGVRPSSFAVSGLGSAPRSGTTADQQHSPSGGAAQSPHSAGPRSSAAGGATPADAASSTTPTANSGSDSATKPRVSGPKPPLPPRTSLTTDRPTVSAAGGSAHPRFSAGSRGGDVVVARGGVRASGPRTSVISADPPTTPDAPPSWVTRSSDRFPLRKSAGGGATTEADGSSTPSTAGPKKTWAPNSAPATAGGRRSELPKPRTSGGGDASADAPAPGPARAVTPEWKREMRQWRSTDASAQPKPGGSTDGDNSMGAGPAVVEEKTEPSAGPAGPVSTRTSLSGSPGKVVDVKVEDDVVTVTEEIPVVRSSLVALKRWSRPRESPAAEGGAKAADKHRRQPSLTDIDTLGPAKKEVGMPVITVRRTSSTKALGLTPNDSPGTAGSPSSSRPSTTPKKLSSPFHAAESRASAATPTAGLVRVSPVKSASVHGTPTQAATGPALLQPSSARKSASLHGTPTAPAGRISSSDSSQSPAISGRPFGAVTVAEYDAGLPENDGYEEVQVRAVEAARSMDTYIRTLIEVIEANGKEDKGRPDALLTITFGELFELTANVFDSLVGIIKTARKYGVVTCAKDQLWQGQDDGEVVGLLKRTHDGIFMNRRRLSAVQRISSKPSATIGGFRSNSIMTEAMNCAVCTKRVYAQEFVAAGDKAYHKACFRCADCNRVLKATDYCNTQGLNYCNSCFNRLVMAAGGAGHE